MRIHRLKLSGFKSFVEPAELRIDPGLTGVVGPNGCGKSNLLEAIRWVMGESSPKSMRGGGMEDVIFAGTDKRPPRSFAEVVLKAETAANAEGVRDELEVVRRIERGAGSAYRINGRDVRAKDVALIFADAATGVRTVPHWYRRAASPPSSPPSPPSDARCLKKRRASRGCTCAARTPSSA